MLEWALGAALGLLWSISDKLGAIRTSLREVAFNQERVATGQERLLRALEDQRYQLGDLKTEVESAKWQLDEQLRNAAHFIRNGPEDDD